MRVEFFIRKNWRLDDEDQEDTTTDEYKACNGTYDLNLVPAVGDLVSFDEGDHERQVISRVINIDPRTGDEHALVALE